MKHSCCTPRFTSAYLPVLIILLVSIGLQGCVSMKTFYGMKSRTFEGLGPGINNVLFVVSPPDSEHRLFEPETLVDHVKLALKTNEIESELLLNDGLMKTSELELKTEGRDFLVKMDINGFYLFRNDYGLVDAVYPNPIHVSVYRVSDHVEIWRGIFSSNSSAQILPKLRYDQLINLIFSNMAKEGVFQTYEPIKAIVPDKPGRGGLFG